MINDILKLIKIEEIVSDYIRIENSSNPNDLRALCPFHADKNPSLSINPEKQVFFCFGCKKGGNAINFIAFIEEITNEEAVDFLKDKLGLVDEKSLLTLLNEVSIYYENKISEIEPYLSNRKLNSFYQQTYRLGYSGSDPFELVQKFPQNKKELQELKLIEVKYANTPSELNFSFFSNRLMIPIITNKGVVGFTGRTLVDNPSKYLNSFDNLYFHRRKTLYGLNKKAIETIKLSGYAYLVEGIFDVQRMQMYGYYNTVGGLGTGLTIEQAKNIKRFCSHVYILYDGDDAGRKATVTTSKILVSVGLTFDVIYIPSSQDPDSYLLENQNLDDSDLINGIEFFTINVTKEEFVELVKQNESLDIIPDKLFKEYQIPKWTLHSKPQKVSLNTKKLTRYTNEMHLALFLDCFPSFEEKLSTNLKDLFLITQSLPEVINLYYNNPYKKIKEPEVVFNQIIKEFKNDC